ncbi:MAG: phenylalanine--tRNA ligase subunit alpha [Bacteroidetes bacterium]|nr:phenylalanine--tRNA ligase subunit alpha [Bacteroidota bacterium]
MIDQLEALQRRALDELDRAGDETALDAWRIAYLGKKGALTAVLRGLGSLPPEERPAVGAAANAAKERLEGALADRRAALEEAARAKARAGERLDVTLPGRRPDLGYLHPTMRIMREMVDVFVGMGFQVAEGPEVEWDYYNFEKLNIPRDHPARDMWSTFYVANAQRPGEMLLRTHTSPNQVRVMERLRPPVRFVVPGKCYRYEAIDASHEAMFYQLEGFAVDETITMADLKGVLTTFARQIFGQDSKVRFRCDYFPFVEPGVEVSIDCHVCRGSGCRLCKGTGWLEILGAGMIHPKVLEGVGYDPGKVSGFAFGMGLERVAMLKYGIDDIRLFYGNDVRFLHQIT